MKGLSIQPWEEVWREFCQLFSGYWQIECISEYGRKRLQAAGVECLTTRAGLIATLADEGYRRALRLAGVGHFPGRGEDKRQWSTGLEHYIFVMLGKRMDEARDRADTRAVKRSGTPGG